MLEIGDELDDRLSKLNKAKSPIPDYAKEILETHKLLMDAFYEMTGLEKRSLASKYLHFHCPKMFFIYDSLARSGINKYVKRPDKRILSDTNCDLEYGDFVCRMLELQTFLFEKLGSYEVPRQMDNFLLQQTPILG